MRNGSVQHPDEDVEVGPDVYMPILKRGLQDLNLNLAEPPSVCLLPVVMASKEDLEIQAKALTDTSVSRDPSPPAPYELKPWERPGLVGKTRKTLRSIQRYVWDDPDKPSAEKWFLLKLDTFLLVASCLGYFSKNLDQANIGNAYVSGVRCLFSSLTKALLY